MLKKISPIFTPELLKTIYEMGHTDVLVIGDGNFPAETTGKESKVLRCDGHTVPELLEGILELFPLDTYTDTPVRLMEVPSDQNVKTPIWDEFKKIVAKHDPRGASVVGTLERMEFYEQARKSYCVVATGETALYANIMLIKGIV